MNDSANELKDKLRRDRELYERDTLVRWEAADALYRSQRALLRTLDETLTTQRFARELGDQALPRATLVAAALELDDRESGAGSSPSTPRSW